MKPRKAIPRKRAKPRRGPAKDEDYLDFVRTMPCVVCYRCESLIIPAEAAHIGLTTSRRGLGQKCPDNETLPLCVAHHREGPDSIHRIGPHAFFERFHLDRDALIRLVQKAFADQNRN